MSLYTIKSLHKKYAAQTVLDLPELIIEEGAIYALLGANGAGKTTLFNLLAFLDIPTSGEIYFRNAKIQHSKSEQLALRRQVILVDQYPLLFSTTVADNLEFGLKIRKIAKAERGRRIDEALDMVDMRPFAGTQAKNLSGGESQRVALARALVLEPQVLLCDEPFSSVDEENQSIIVELFRRLNKKDRMSILFTTHDRGLAASLTRRTIHLDRGRLIEAGDKKKQKNKDINSAERQ